MTWAQGLFRRLGDGTGLMAVLLAGGLFYLSPWLVLTLISGFLLCLLIILRPELGLALVIATSPLYLHPVSLFGRTFSLAELILLPTLVGWAVAFLGKLGERYTSSGGEAELLVDRAEGLQGARFSDLIPAVVFVAVALVSTLLAQYRHEALRELRVVILEPVLFYAVAVTLPMRARDRWRILDFYVASAVGVAVIGLVQYFLLGDFITAEGGIRRLRSIYGSPNNVGLYLGRVWPFLLALLIGGWEQTKTVSQGRRRFLPRGRSLYYGLALLPVGLALLLSLSRGAILLGVPAGLLIFGLFSERRWRYLAFALLVIFGIALIPLFQTPRFAGLLDPSRGTTALRLSLWRSAWQMFLDHPFWGVGPDNFLYAYRTRYVLPSAWEEFNLAHPHNWVLDFASRLGLGGVIVFVWMLVRFCKRVKPLVRDPEPQRRALALGCTASMMASLAHGFVDASYFYIDLAFVFFFTLAVVIWIERGLMDSDSLYG
jgi:O-antigen ligase